MEDTKKKGDRSEPISHAKEQRRKEDQNSFVLCLERWVSRSVVNRADVRGGIWDVEVVKEIIGRPLHHTLLIVESQQDFFSVVQCSSHLHPPRSLLPPKRDKTGRCRVGGARPPPPLHLHSASTQRSDQSNSCFFRNEDFSTLRVGYFWARCAACLRAILFPCSPPNASRKSASMLAASR